MFPETKQADLSPNTSDLYMEGVWLEFRLEYRLP
jgi:hypothetical protein